MKHIFPKNSFQNFVPGILTTIQIPPKFNPTLNLNSSLLKTTMSGKNSKNTSTKSKNGKTDLVNINANDLAEYINVKSRSKEGRLELLRFLSGLARASNVAHRRELKNAVGTALQLESADGKELTKGMPVRVYPLTKKSNIAGINGIPGFDGGYTIKNPSPKGKTDKKDPKKSIPKGVFGVIQAVDAKKKLLSVLVWFHRDPTFPIEKGVGTANSKLKFLPMESTSGRAVPHYKTFIHKLVTVKPEQVFRKNVGKVKGVLKKMLLRDDQKYQDAQDALLVKEEMDQGVAAEADGSDSGDIDDATDDDIDLDDIDDYGDAVVDAAVKVIKLHDDDDDDEPIIGAEATDQTDTDGEDHSDEESTEED